MMDMNALADLFSPTDRRGRVYGMVVGVVTNNQDPDGLGRVKVKFPWLSEEDESFWARVVTPMAGNARGLYFLPEVDDEVLLAFEHGDVRFPYVLGALWNGQDKPPESNDDGKNDRRTIKSRSGHIIRLDDSDEAKIEIVDKTGKNSVVIDSSANTITISADADIVIRSSSGKLTLSGNGVEITSQAGIKVEAGSNLDLNASAQTNVRGAVVNIN